MRIMISTTALTFLIIAAALEPEDKDIRDSEISGYLESKDQFGASQFNLHTPLRSEKQFITSRFNHGLYRPADCCFSYTTRKIRCRNMKYYFKTSSECFLPAIIFVTKKGKQVCADPKDLTVQMCMFNLSSVPKNLERLRHTLQMR